MVASITVIAIDPSNFPINIVNYIRAIVGVQIDILHRQFSQKYQ